MGDRTTVTLTVLASQAEAVRKTVEGEGIDDEHSRAPLYDFVFYEVNYGNLDCLTELYKAGIAYDSRWDAGSDYSAGTESARFTADGELVTKEIYDHSQNPDLEALMNYIDDSVKLRQFILSFAETVKILPWDNQEDYGKRYRAKQLISA